MRKDKEDRDPLPGFEIPAESEQLLLGGLYLRAERSGQGITTLDESVEIERMRPFNLPANPRVEVDRIRNHVGSLDLELMNLTDLNEV